jgi:hypothetical protein
MSVEDECRRRRDESVSRTVNISSIVGIVWCGDDST